VVLGWGWMGLGGSRGWLWGWRGPSEGGGKVGSVSPRRGCGQGLRRWGWEPGEAVLSHAAELASRTAASGSLRPPAVGKM